MAAMRRALHTTPRFLLTRPSSARPFSTSIARFAGKEDSLHQDGRADEAEHYKQKQLKEQKEGKGHWTDELASNSESIVKAERDEIDANEYTIEKLQKESEELMKKKDKAS